MVIYSYVPSIWFAFERTICGFKLGSSVNIRLEYENEPQAQNTYYNTHIGDSQHSRQT